MTIQAQRLDHLCEKLGLNGVLCNYSNLAQTARNKQQSYTDFLEKILEEKYSSRTIKCRQMMLKTAGFPI